MRWDDQSINDCAKHDSQSSFNTPFASNNNSSLDLQSMGFPKDFSPDIPMELMNFRLDGLPEYSPMAASPTENTQSRPSLSSSLGNGPTNRKRKSSSDDSQGNLANSVAQGLNTTGTTTKKVPSKKRAHNVIEKRYRANLNDRITELRDSVPSLRVIAKQTNGAGFDDDDADGATSTNKMNKASILSKATDYIHHLEIRNKRLEEENTALKNRLRDSDKAVDQNVTSAASVSSPSNCTVSTESGSSSSPSVFSNAEDDPSDSSSSPSHRAEGMIKLPDSFRRMRAAASNQSGLYGQSYMQHGNRSNREYASEESGCKRSNLPNKYMLGALAGLMVLEGVGTEKKSESTSKGLLAVPFNLLNHLDSPTLRYWPLVLRNSRFSWHAQVVTHFLVLATLVVGSAFVVFLYLFNAQPSRQSDSVKTAAVSEAALSSPWNFRRQAWLTSIQQVGVPRHRFFSEWYTVTSRCFEYLFRCLFGWKFYSWATGVTEEDEKGRVKTWDIAIDAQLAGGDLEISKSRLVLTIFAAGTLPRSPLRMMLKALHCRILLWRVGDSDSWTFRLSNDVARALAKYQWELAREMNKQLPKDHEEALPSHLAALLELDPEEVMIDSIVQRAANLTWNRPTQEGTDDDAALLDVVEEDPAIQSSLDALASWWSSYLLQRALLKYFEASSGSAAAKKNRDIFKAKIDCALDVAPQPSAAHTRALVMKAIFFEQDRIQNIGMVLDALPSEKDKEKHTPAFNFLDSSLPVSVREEISVAVRCAMIAAIFKARFTGDTSMPPYFTIERAITWFNQLPIDPVELTLLGFAAVFHLLHVLSSDVEQPLVDSSSSVASDADSSSTVSTDCSSEQSSTPSTLASTDDDVKTMPSRRPCLPPQYMSDFGHVASELMYWARNAYNPAFYGFTDKHVEVIENECRSLCQGAGINVEDYSRARQELNAKKRKQKKERSSRKSSPRGAPVPVN